MTIDATFGAPFHNTIEPTADSEQIRERQAASLQREREGYVLRGLTDRVAAVDAELARLGVPPADGAGATPKRRAERRPKSAARAKAEKRG